MKTRHSLSLCFNIFLVHSVFELMDVGCVFQSDSLVHFFDMYSSVFQYCNLIFRHIERGKASIFKGNLAIKGRASGTYQILHC